MAILVLSFWIPVGVFKTPDVWHSSWQIRDRSWKSWAWFVLNCVPANLFLSFLPFLGNLIWKATRRWGGRWLSWPLRILACLPPLSLLLSPLFLRESRFLHLLKREQRSEETGKDPFRALRRVASFYAVLVAIGFAIAVFGRAPTVIVKPGGQHLSEDLSDEREFIFGDGDRRPDLCVSLSGGGIRSAAFSLGALHALHDLDILENVDVISAVSGGTYALSWLILQPYYAQQAQGLETIEPKATLASLFSHTGRYQTHVWDSSAFVERSALGFSIFQDMVFGQLWRSIVAGSGSESLPTTTKGLYARRIQFTFHRHPKEAASTLASFTNNLTLAPEVASLPTSLWDVHNVEFSSSGRLSPVPRDLFLDNEKSPGLQEFLRSVNRAGKGSLPFPVFNAKLTVDADRTLNGQIWPAHFEITPLGLGGPAVNYVGWDTVSGPSYSAIRSANIAPAVSGAAVSGYSQAGHPFWRWLVRVLNVDLGYSVRNPFSANPRFIYLSDGGHSENLGLYALIRRECQTIVAVDAEYEAGATGKQAGKYDFEAYRRLAKALRQEGATRLLWKGEDEKAAVDRDFMPAAFDPAHPVLEARIVYPNRDPAAVVYIKLAMDRQAQLPADVTSYLPEDTDGRFPHDPTTKQEYTFRQFKAYESLGYYLTYESDAVQSLRLTRAP